MNKFTIAQVSIELNNGQLWANMQIQLFFSFRDGSDGGISTLATGNPSQSLVSLTLTGSVVVMTLPSSRLLTVKKLWLDDDISLRVCFVGYIHVERLGLA